MKFLLDSNAVIGMLRGDGKLLARMRRQEPRDLVLVTHNTGEFSHVSGLRLKDWQG